MNIIPVSLVIILMLTGCNFFEDEKKSKPTVYTTANPVISPSDENITIDDIVSIKSDTPGAYIYYTLDGTDPSEDSLLYSGGFALSIGSQRVKAIAVKPGYNTSSITEKLYEVFAGRVAKVTLSEPSDIYSESVVVSLESTTADASIYYTLDGSEPDQSSLLYDGTPLTISESTKIRTYAVKSGFVDSEVTGGNYVIGVVAEGEGDLLITEIGAAYAYYVNSPFWFELYNPTDTAIDLSPYQLRSYSIYEVIEGEESSWYVYGDVNDMILYDLGTKSIQPGEYQTVMVQNSLSPQQVPDTLSYILPVETGGYSYTPYWGSWALLDLVKNGQSVDFVRCGEEPLGPVSGSFQGSGPALPNSISSYGYSIARDLLLTDTDSGSDWNLIRYSTPGGQNDISSGADDADNDGIPDEAESPGGTYGGLPLYDFGARPGRPDIFVYVDYMDPSGSGSYDAGMDPQKEAFQKVKDSFAAEGFSLHIDAGDKYHQAPGYSPEDFDLSDTNHQIPFSQYLTLDQPDGGQSLYDIKGGSFPQMARWIYRYCIFGFRQGGSFVGSSGLAELGTPEMGGGSDFIVTLGGWGMTLDTLEDQNDVINTQAGTFMHELGHNLGLRHGGDENQNYKPNYYSIMNYLYQLNGLPVIGSTREGDRYYYQQFRWASQAENDIESAKWKNILADLSGGTSYWYLERGATSDPADIVLTYSRGVGVNLNEGFIDESQGLGQEGSASVDYNGDGSTQVGVVYNTNHGDSSDDAGTTVLSDHDDWSNLILPIARDFYDASRSLSDFDPELMTWDRMPTITEDPNLMQNRNP